MQKTFTQKTLSLFVALALCFSVLSVTAFAAGTAEYSFNTPSNSEATNGITATVDAIASEDPDSTPGMATDGETVTATIAFTGTAVLAGKFTIDLASDGTTVSTPVDINVSAGATGASMGKKAISFTMPEGDVDSLELILTFVDNAKPTVVSVSPSGSSVPANTGSLVITFSEPMDTGTGTVAVTATSGTVVATLGSSSWSNGNKTITCALPALEYPATYEVDITNFEDAVGNKMDQDKTNTFSTIEPSSGKSSSGSGSSSSGSGGSGGGGFTPTIPVSSNVSAGGEVSGKTATTELNSALKQAPAGGKAVISVKNGQSISAETLKSLAAAAEKSGKQALIMADTTTTAGSVIGRLYINPANLNNGIKLGLTTDGVKPVATKSKFEKHFNNKVAVVSFEQQGSFGAKIKVAVKVALPQNTKNLMFYSYDAKTNKFTKVDTKYYIDANGYLHFETALAGDIIISDGPLKKK